MGRPDPHRAGGRLESQDGGRTVKTPHLAPRTPAAHLALIRHRPQRAQGVLLPPPWTPGTIPSALRPPRMIPCGHLPGVNSKTHTTNPRHALNALILELLYPRLFDWRRPLQKASLSTPPKANQPSAPTHQKHPPPTSTTKKQPSSSRMQSAPHPPLELGLSQVTEAGALLQGGCKNREVVRIEAGGMSKGRSAQCTHAMQ